MSTTTTTTIRRGDHVKLPDGRIAKVTSTAGGFIFTIYGTYAPWQVERIEAQP